MGSEAPCAAMSCISRSTVAYRSAGCRLIAVSTIVSRSPRRRGSPDATLGARRLRLQHATRELHARRGVLVWPPAREKDVQERSQGVHVGRGRDGLARQLLGAGEVGRHDPRGGPVEAVAAGLHELGDAEVEQTRHPRAVHEDVGRLDVPVDHELCVRVSDGLANLAEEVEPLVDPEPVSVAVGVDRLAVHVLHDRIGDTLGGRAAVEEACHAGMLQARQDPSLVAEAPAHLLVVEGAGKQLDGNALVEVRVLTDAEVHDAHAAAAELLREPIGPDPRSQGLVDQNPRASGRAGDDTLQRLTEPRASEVDEALYFATQPVVAVGVLREIRGPLLRRTGHHILEQLFDSRPILGADRLGHPGIVAVRSAPTPSTVRAP